MNSSTRLILIVGNTAGTMTATDWLRRLNDSAANVDNTIYLLPPPQVGVIMGPQAREKRYWEPRFERFKKHRGKR